MILEQLETELVAICQQLRSFTVEIANHRSGGSGVIWSADGLIITNSHVVRGSRVDVKLEDGKVVKGSVIARAPQQDLAAIQIDGKKLPTPTIGNSQNLRPGELVLVMGSPWGYRGALTTLPQSASPLTFREVEVLQLLAAGLDNKAIALKLQISKHTVKFHISSILSKLNVSSRTEAVTFGLRQLVKK